MPGIIFSTISFRPGATSLTFSFTPGKISSAFIIAALTNLSPLPTQVGNGVRLRYLGIDWLPLFG